MDGGGKGGREPGKRGVWIYAEGVMSFANGAKEGQHYNVIRKKTIRAFNLD